MTTPPPRPVEPLRIRRDLPWAVALGVAAALAFLPALRYGFVWDDPAVHREMRTGKSLWGDYYAGSEVRDPSGYFRPFFLLSWKIDAALHGWTDAAGWHATNLALHGLGTALFFLLLRRLGAGGFWSAVGAGVHAVHPTRVEVVAWVSARMDLLAALFILVAGHGLLGLMQARSRAASAAWGGLATAGYAASILSKEMAFGWPVAVLALGAFHPARRRRVLGLGAVGVVAAAAFLAARQALLDSPPAYTPWVPSLIGRVFFSAQLILRYLTVFLWPGAPNPIPEVTPNIVQALAGWGVAFALAVGIGRSAQRAMPAWLCLTALLFFFPVSQIIPIGFLFADRFGFVPSIPLLAWVALALQRGLPLVSATAERWARPVAAVWIGGLLALSRQRLPVWQSNLTLFERAAEASPRDALAALNHGQALEEAGRKTEAEAEYRHALQIDPQQDMALYNLGLLLHRQGENAQALEWLRRVPESAAAYPSARKLATQIYLVEGLNDPARRMLERPGGERDPEVHFQKGNLAASQGRFEEAADHYQRALALDPELDAARLNLGKSHLEMGRYVEALKALEDFPEDSPLFVDALFTRANARFGAEDVRGAERDFLRVLEADPEHAFALYNLMSLYQQTGQAEKAEALRPRLQAVRAPQP